MKKIILDASSNLENGWNRRKLRSFLTKLTAFIPSSLHLIVNHIDNDSMRDINAKYRGKNTATNILSFKYPDKKNIGELILAIDIVKDEAAEMCLSFDQHYAHLIVHGILHLFGYDHEIDSEAEVMEGLEKTWLQALGYKDPYIEQ